jgi:hypothetical protein
MEAVVSTVDRLRLPLFGGLHWCVALLAAWFLASCATVPINPPPGDRGNPSIMGRETIPLDRFLAVVERRNPSLGTQGWTNVWQAYADACDTEGVRQSVALVQMLHETNWLRFGGDVKLSQNNFAGLGVTGGGTAGLSFPDVRTGALAHVQHLKAYASYDPPSATLVDPRFRYVKRGSAPTVRSLTGKWAMDPGYGDKLMRLYGTMAG